MSYDLNSLWQDRQVIFDGSKSEFVFRQGEETYKTMSNIEDVKGNNEIGTFIFTNLRLIWYNNKNPKINQSIGYDCIENLEKKYLDSMMTGQSNILTIFCRVDKNRYELTYRTSSESSHDPYVNLSNILKLYDQGRLYREIKQNNENICDKSDKSIILLKDEKIIETIKKIYLEQNNDDNNQGTLYKTNIRLIWINDKNSSINLSMPWIQISSIRGEMNDKLGISVRIKLTKIYNNTSYLFYSKEGIVTKEFCENLSNNMSKMLVNPILSLSLRKNDSSESSKDKFKEKIGKIADMVYGQEEISEKNEEDQAGMIYLINEGRNKQNNINNIEFSKELGIACEKLPDKVTISDLWKIIK
jgi:Bardet-Biedl syndrome 5 protein